MKFSILQKNILVLVLAISLILLYPYLRGWLNPRKAQSLKKNTSVDRPPPKNRQILTSDSQNNQAAPTTAEPPVSKPTPNSKLSEIELLLN